MIVYLIQWFKSLLNYYSLKDLIGKLQLSIYFCQLNTCIHEATKATPFNLVYGQSRRAIVFPSVTAHALEDVEDLLGKD